MASDTHLLSLFLYLTMLTPSLQQQCPSGCRCPSGTEVRCSNADLTAFPPNIPTTVEKLFLDGNHISEVNSYHISALPRLKQLYLPRNRIRSVKNFANLPNLEILNLASNNISYVDNDAFENSTRLKYIFLSKNSLTDVPTGLERLDNLQILTLDDNNIRTVSAAFFSSVGSILRIDLHNNPWSCDCHLRDFKNWMSATSAEISLRENVTCASPENLIGRAIDDVRADDMVCATTATVDNETTKGKTTTITTLTTTKTTDVDVHSTRSTIVYSSLSSKAIATTGRTTTHTQSLAPTMSGHPTIATRSKGEQMSQTNATKPLITPKSTSVHRPRDDHKLILIICVPVLGGALLIVGLIFWRYRPSCKRRPRPPGHGRANVGYRPDPVDGPVVYIGDGRNAEEKVVTERQLRALSENLGMEWEQLSTELGFTNAQLWQFKEDNPRNVRQAMFEMLNKWRRNHRREATIGRLVQHMRNVNIDEDTYGVLLN